MEFDYGNRRFPLGGLNDAEWALSRPLWRQVHGTAIAEVRSPSQECGEVDGLWTQIPGLAIAVVTADCVPILLEHDSGKAVAALHGGWRGIHAGIVDSFLSSLPPELRVPSAWSARIGPCIRSCCYEVSPELIDDFIHRFPEISRNQIEPSPRMLDLVSILSEVLRKLGVRIHEIQPDCTRCKEIEGKPLYFSYRRGDRNSRQYSWVRIPSKN
jgi:YfiH family protein